MKIAYTIFGLSALVLIAVTVYGVSFYNTLQTKIQSVDSQWAQVETQYQRRLDLIPNLVSTVKGLFAQEQAVFGEIAEARTRYSGAKGSDAKAAAAGQLDSALSRLLVIVESYPEIKSDKTVVGLMDELAGTENRISVERRRFNESVQDYNLIIKRVPGNFFAGLFGFKEKQYYKASVGAESAPEVKF